MKHGVRTGAYEWHPVTSTLSSGERETPPELTMEGAIKFETASGKSISCNTLAVSSELTLTGPQTQRTPLWVFNGCESEGLPCKAAHSPEQGEIENTYAWFEEPAEEGLPVPGWRGQLGFITRGASPVVGNQYSVLNDERLFEPIVCQSSLGTVWIGGEHNGGDAFSETYAQSAPGTPSVSRLVNHRKVYIEAFFDQHWEPVAITATFTFGFEGGRAVEIKAIP
jgi:hypothetical protein